MSVDYKTQGAAKLEATLVTFEALLDKYVFPRRKTFYKPFHSSSI